MGKIWVKDNDISRKTPIGGSVDVDRYRFCIEDAQLVTLEEILGEDLYNKVETLVDINAAFPAGDYKILFDDYITPFLIHQAAVEYIKVGSYRIENNGISKPAPPNSSAVEAAEIYALVRNQTNKADVWRGRLEKYLVKSNLPEYRQGSDSIVKPTNQTGGQSWLFSSDV
jgi:hypothetical protein